MRNGEEAEFMDDVPSRRDCGCQCNRAKPDTGQMDKAANSRAKVTFTVYVLSSRVGVLACFGGVDRVRLWLAKHQRLSFDRDPHGGVKGAWPFKNLPDGTGFFTVVFYAYSASADEITLSDETWRRA